ncbi:MAG: LPXTG cell wall anchor domain-containing protein [Eubacteriales bacterium]
MNLPYEYLVMNPYTNDKPVVWIVVIGVAALAAMIFLITTKKKK